MIKSIFYKSREKISRTGGEERRVGLLQVLALVLGHVGGVGLRAALRGALEPRLGRAPTPLARGLRPPPLPPPQVPRLA